MTERVPTMAEIKKALALYQSFKACQVAMAPTAAKVMQEAAEMYRIMRDLGEREKEALADYKDLLRQRKRALNQHAGGL